MADEDDNYRLLAAKVYERLIADRQRSFTGHLEYGKWMIASMLAVHGGAIYALINIREIFPADHKAALIYAAMFNVIGIVLIMVSAFTAWMNLQLAETIIGEWINPAMLFDRESFPKTEERKFDWITATLYIAAGTGLASLACFIVAALIVFRGLLAGIPIG